MKNENKGIDVRDLFLSLLHSWKWIVAAMVALALLFGLAQDITGKKPAASAEGMTALDDRIEIQSSYMENSILMQLDPYNVYEATATVHITKNKLPIDQDADSLEIARYVCAYYCTALDNTLYTHLTDVTEIMPNYLKELITLDNSNSPILTVKVCHRSAEQADILLQEILDYVQDELPAPMEQYGVQANVLATVSTIRTDIHAQQLQEHTSLELAMSKRNATADSRNQIISMAILGGIFGVVVSVLMLAAAFIHSRKNCPGQMKQN